MRGILTPEQMAAADRATIEAGTPSMVLMERAGRAVAQAALGLAGGAYGRRVAIFCGKGNNGGDGFVAARHLASFGAYPVVVLVEDPAGLKGDALENFRRLEGTRKIAFEPDRARRELGRSHVVVDAMVGTGFRGRLAGPIAEAASLINLSGIPVVAADIPSGVDGATGEVSGEAVAAAVTVTMGALKAGLVLWPGSEYAGRVEIVDIGIDLSSVPAGLLLVSADDVKEVLAPRTPSDDKRSVGTVLVVAASKGMGGAAALVARGALRAGAGLVTVAAPESVAGGLHHLVAEGTTISLPETDRGTVGAAALPVLLERAGKVGAVAIGPGLSRHHETAEFVHKAAAEIDRPMVIDADAVNAFEGEPEALASRTAPTVLTPHVRELSRLTGMAVEEIQRDRPGAARAAAARAGAVVLLKGYRTIVAEPSGTAWVVAVGGPVLATGGSGDVLTGVLAALLAATGDPSRAAWAAAWLHGKTGDLLAEMRGTRGVIAGEIADMVPDVISLVRSEGGR